MGFFFNLFGKPEPDQESSDRDPQTQRFFDAVRKHDAEERRLKASSLEGEDEHLARRIYKIAGGLAHFASRNPKAAENIRSEILKIGETLSSHGGKERMGRVAERVRDLGMRDMGWQAIWDGLAGPEEGDKPAGRPDNESSEEDRAYLEAPPFDRLRSFLLWLDAGRLSQMKEQLKPGDQPTTFILDDGEAMKEFYYSYADLEWAQRIGETVDAADAAGRSGRFQEAVGGYKEALRSAPGCDFLLMSLGVCYIRLGKKEKGLRYLERAAEISPHNERILRNLSMARGS